MKNPSMVDPGRVLVVDDGRVVEDGAPSDLRQRSGRYGLLHRQWVESLA